MEFKPRPKKRKVDPELVSALVDLLLSIVGDSVKGRIARAAIVGAVVAAAQWYSPDSTPIVQAVESQKK